MRAVLVVLALALASHAQAQSEPKNLFLEQVSGWEVAGFLMYDGAVAACRMMKPAKSGDVLAYVTMIGNSPDGPVSKALFAFSSLFETGDIVTGKATFDGERTYPLRVGFTSGLAHAEFPENMKLFIGLVNDLQRGRSMIIEIGDGPATQTVEVNLSGSAAAFDANGRCMKQMVDVAVMLGRARGQP